MTASREDITETVFRLGPHVRYVAFGQGQAISTDQHEDLRAPSESSSDFYEELLVNPALLPLPDGTRHLSVCLEREADVNAVDAQLREILTSTSAT